MAKPNKGLGRGLDALLLGGEAAASVEDELRELAVGLLQPGKYQPRTHMDEASLNELAASIKAQGVMQPILVRELDAGGYEIIAGERRWRASQLAGLSHVPVLVRRVADNVALAMALIENIQRENLNPLEEAIGIQRLVDEFSLTHQEAADAVGRSRSAASNLLRLLKLSEPLQEMLMQGRLDMGHARALLSLEGIEQVTLGHKIAVEQLSVRQAEKLVAHALKPAKARAEAKPDRDVLRFQEELSEAMGTQVEIRQGKKGGGRLIIDYANPEHLDELIARLK